MLPSHQNFITLIALGAKQGEAYRRTINNKCTMATSRQNGSRLAKRYATQIAEAKKLSQTTEQTQTPPPPEPDKIAALHEADLNLARIIREQIKTSPSDILRAIDMYYKRFKGYKTEKPAMEIPEIILPPIDE